MGIFATLLTWLGCSEKKKEAGISKEFEEQLDKSIEAFKNRPIYKELTVQNIDSTSDDNLLQVVFDNLSEKIATDFEKEYEIVMSWNKSRQAIFMIWLLEGEVNNGGYNQFYYNSSGKFYKHLPEALKLVGAEKFADLSERANRTFETENEKITKDQDGTLEGFSKSYEDNPLDVFDTEYYKLEKVENLHQLQIDYIRRNKKDFIDK